MKNVLFAAAAAAAVLVAAPAFAQDASSDVQWYGSLGYSFYDTDIGGAQIGAVQGRVGARFHNYFGIEGEGAIGVDNDSVAGTSVKLNNSEAIYAVGFVPLTPQFDLIGRVGVGSSDFKVGGVSNSDTSVNYGAGAQWSFDDSNAVRGDYTRVDGDNATSDVWSLSYVRKF